MGQMGKSIEKKRNKQDDTNIMGQKENKQHQKKQANAKILFWNLTELGEDAIGYILKRGRNYVAIGIAEHRLAGNKLDDTKKNQ